MVVGAAANEGDMSAEGAVAPSYPVEDVPRRLLHEAFVRETRIGVMLALIARFLMGLQSLARWYFSDRTQNWVSFFQWRNLVVICIGVEDILLLAFLFFVARSKRPLLWFAIAFGIDFAVTTQFKYWWLGWLPGMDAMPLFINVAYLDVFEFMLMLAICALPLSRKFVVWFGAATLAVFAVGTVQAFVVWPHAFLYTGPFGPGMGDANLRLMHDPETLVIDYFVLQLIQVGIITWLVICSVEEGRGYVVLRTRAEAGFAFLAKFFAPAVANRIFESGRIEPARRRVAVAFVDVAGPSPDTEFARLQEHYVWVEQCAFAHDGVIDRFTGGPIMLSFGAVVADETAAKKALDCALALVKGSEPLRIALHFGEAVSGEFGGTRSRTFSVVGDVVNTTRRVLDLAAESGFPLIATEELVAALPARPDGLEALPPATLRGRTAPVSLWRVPA